MFGRSRATRLLRSDPCSGCLDDMARDPSFPIVFDAEVDEYYFSFQADGGEGKLMIRHCPLCGGSLPLSRTNEVRFQFVPSAEEKRLFELIQPLKSENAIIPALGEPDERQAVGGSIKTRQRGDHPAETEAYSSMTYTRLSDTANILIMVFSDGRIRHIVLPKPKSTE